MNATAYHRLVEDLRADGRNVVEDGSGRRAKAQCPAHHDTSPSLSVTAMEGMVLVYCHAGCETDAVMKKLGRSEADLFDTCKGAGYRYPDGRIVNRRPGKSFSQQGNTKGNALYRGDQIADATTVYVVEGEKDVLAVESAGGCAVCSAMGAGKAPLADWSPVTGKHVVVVADKDEPGRKHARDVVRLVTGIAASVTVVEARTGKDAAAHIAAERGLDDFVDAAIGAEAPTDDDDPEPTPLTNRVTIPAFPVGSLPAPIGDMVSALAEATQTDPAMAGTSALSCLSTCTGGHAEVQVRPGWLEPLCLYLATVAAPGERKSAVQQAMVAPIYDVEHDMVDKGMGHRMEQEARKVVAQKAAERARNAAAAVTGKEQQDKALADAIGASQLAESIEVPVIPRLVADDVTPEAAASLLAEQGGRLAIISAEGGVFDIIAGRYSKSVPNMDIWLKGHSGDPIKVDRKGREPEYIRRPALTLGLMIQPTVLTNLAANRDFRGRGFLARILYSYPVSKVGSREIATTPVSMEIKAAYELAVQELARGMVEWADDPAVLVLTTAAEAAIQDIERAVEPTLIRDGELAALPDWGAKYVGAVVRIAGILHLAKYGSEAGPRRALDEVTIAEAAAIGEFFKASAINAFADMGMDSSMADAVYLLDRIKTAVGLGVEQSARDLHRLTMSRFKTVADLRPALETLTDYGWLIPLEPPQAGSTGGRPSSPRFRIWST